MSQITLTPGQGRSFIQRVEAWFAEWRRFGRQVGAQAELERKLRGVDEHLLRDMGLRWSDNRIERITPDH